MTTCARVVQIRFVNRRFPTLQRVGFSFDTVNAYHIVSDLGQTCARNQSDIVCTDHRYTHR